MTSKMYFANQNEIIRHAIQLLRADIDSYSCHALNHAYGGAVFYESKVDPFSEYANFKREYYCRNNGKPWWDIGFVSTEKDAEFREQRINALLDMLTYETKEI